jgi:hypothetical protein
MLVYPSTEINTNYDTSNVELTSTITNINAVADVSQAPSKSGANQFTAETQFSIAKFLERPRRVAVGVSGSGMQSALRTNFMLTTEVAKVMGGWKLCRGDTRIIVSYTGNPNVLGLYRLWFVPFPSQTNYSLSSFDPGFMASDPLALGSSEQLPHLDLDLSMAQTMEISLPYFANQEYLAMNDIDWVMYGQPVIRAESAFGLTPPVITIEVFMSMHNVSLNVVMPQGEIIPQGDAYASRSLHFMADFAQRVEQGGAFISSVTRALASGAQALGYSRPLVEPVDIRVVRSVGNMSLMSGQPVFGQTMASDPAQSRDMNKASYPSIDTVDDDLRSIRRKWGLQRTIWNPEQLIDVDPSFLSSEFQKTTGQLVTTPLLYQALAFEWWRGSIDYRIQVISSPLIRVRMGVVVVPPLAAVPAAFPTSGDYITYVFETAGSSVYDINVPWMYAPGHLDTVAPFTTHDINRTRILFFWLTIPTGPSPTPVYPKVMLKVRAGEDFDFGVPNLQLLDAYTVIPTPLTLRDEVIPQGDAGFTKRTFGEEFTTVTQLAKRSSYHFALRAVTDEDKPMSWPADGFFANKELILLGDASVSNVSWTFDLWGRAMYAGYSGGTQWKICTPTETTNVPYRVWQNYDALSDETERYVSSATGSVTIRPSLVAFGEITSPDRCFNRFKRSFEYPQNAAIYLSENMYMLNIGLEDDTTSAELFQSAADDRMFIGFLCTPFLYLKAL